MTPEQEAKVRELLAEHKGTVAVARLAGVSVRDVLDVRRSVRREARS